MAPKSFIFVSSFELWGWLAANLSASRRSLLDDYQSFEGPAQANNGILLYPKELVSTGAMREGFP
jgi:hypothetical protein